MENFFIDAKSLPSLDTLRACGVFTMPKDFCQDNSNSLTLLTLQPSPRNGVNFPTPQNPRPHLAVSSCTPSNPPASTPRELSMAGSKPQGHTTQESTATLSSSRLLQPGSCLRPDDVSLPPLETQ